MFNMTTNRQLKTKKISLKRTMLALSFTSVLAVAFSATAAKADIKVGANITIPFSNAMVNIQVGDLLYGFYEGSFYRPTGKGRYRLVEAPIGAVIPVLPKGYKREANHFKYGNVYYLQTPNGYRVINHSTKTVIRDSKGFKDQKAHHSDKNKHQKNAYNNSKNGHGKSAKDRNEKGRNDSRSKSGFQKDNRQYSSYGERH
jgi:hypothetical protein